MGLIFYLTGFSLVCGCPPDWGFFGHRMINRHAVYAIPAPLNQFYRQHIGWVEEHGVDADKRRYASPQEYKRHYIDLDHFEKDGEPLLSPHLPQEIRHRLHLFAVTHQRDTLALTSSGPSLFLPGNEDAGEGWSLGPFLTLWDTLYANDPYDEQWMVEMTDLPDTLFGGKKPASWARMIFADSFSLHGILPYWLEINQKRLVQAFIRKDIPGILRLSADLGHYIGDAHVPLHTTRNYNGQLTGQHGIHGFWESRIPELFFEEWDLVTGPADYISDFRAWSWTLVRESHSHVAEVLDKERQQRAMFPEDQVLCFEDRNTQNLLTYCPDYARAYAQSMDGMVEERLRSSIHGIASAWYTAWIDAGQPDLWEELPSIQLEEEPSSDPASEGPYGRPHE